jgi:hypothetical protein
MHTALRLGTRAAVRARELNPSAHICFYGTYAGLNRDYLLAHFADTCLGAEFEADLLELTRRIHSMPPGRGPRDVRIETDATAHTRSLNLTPDRTRLRSHRGYVRLDDGAAERGVGCVTTTRGCKHTCRHCPLTPAYRGRFYALPADAVMADIGSLVASGATHITFADPDFFNGPTHALRIARRLHRMHPGVTFDYTAKIEHLLCHRAVVEELQDLGNLFVVSAVESLNDDVLAALDKGHTRADALSVFRHFRAVGLTLRPSLLPFTPWETVDSYIDLIDTFVFEDLVDHVDPVQFSIRLLVPPGSWLVDTPSMRPFLGDLDQANFTHRWTHPDPRMDALHAEIAAIVERAAVDARDPHDTFDAVRIAAHRARDGAETPRLVRGRRRVPRLTEAWFC